MSEGELPEVATAFAVDVFGSLFDGLVVASFVVDLVGV